MTRCFATVITRSYLADARALAASIRRFHDDPIYVLCVDDPEGYFDPKAEPFTVLTLDDVLPPEDRPLVFYYTAFELCCACRAYLHQYLFQRTAHTAWAFLDSDIWVTAPLDPMFELLATPDVYGLFTPHCLDPAPVALMEPVETSLQRFGIYNGGFLALKRTTEAHAFVQWFVPRLRSLCFFMDHEVYVDQLWMNFLPELFPGIHSWKHRGANVAYWNIHERILTQSGDVFRADGQPLLFAHFSRWSPERPHEFAWGRPLAKGTDATAVAALGEAYREALLAADYHRCRSWPYGHSRFRNGRAISKPMRRAFYDAWIQGQAAAGIPFDHPEWFPVWKFPPDVKGMARRWLRPMRNLLKAK
jgi:hypothetical protein